MRETGHCPRCHSDQVRQVAGSRPGDSRDSAEPPPFGPAAVTRYECQDCSYAEEWVESGEELDAIRRLAGVG